MEIGLLSRIKYYFCRIKYYFLGETKDDSEKGLKSKEIQIKEICIENYKSILSHLERSLRKKGGEILEEIKKKKKRLTTEETAIEIGKLNQEIKKCEDDITQIEKTISFSGDDLFQTFDDYNQFFFNFMAGYESSTVKTIFEKGYPRAGFMVYMKHWDSEVTDGYSGWYLPVYHSLHHAFTAQITSSAEQDIKIDTTKSPDTTGTKNALEFEMLFFSPIYRFERLNWGKLWEYAGPIAIIGGKKTDDDRRINLRVYRGIRFATSPEHYADIMVGETADLKSQRIEVRGQLPVYKFDGGTRLYLGAIGNFGLTKETHKVTDKATGTEKDEVEADVIRVYLTWNVEFKDIFGNSSKK